MNIHGPKTMRGRAAGALAVVLLVTGCAAPGPDGADERSDRPLATTASTDTGPHPSASADPVGTPPPSRSNERATPPASPRPPTPEPSAADGPVDVAVARERLARLPVKGRAPLTGYSREEFGQRWSDDVPVEFGHNGCDTRNDILRRDLREITVRPNTRGCVVLTGVLHDPYTGDRIEFVRGADTSAEVQVDHVVALADAWQKGGRELDPDTRRAFANDPRNLQAVAGRANQQKRAGDAATWLPPRRAHRCLYVARQIEVKVAYGLWVTPAERDALDCELGRCSASPAEAPAHG